MTFTGSASGTIAVTITPNACGYVLSGISVEYTKTDNRSNLATFAWSASTANPFIDGEAPTFTAEYTAGNPVPANLITFGSTDPEVAEVVNGVVVMKKAGTTTLSASFAGNDDYAPHATVNYELTVRLHSSNALYFKDADNNHLANGATVSYELNSEYTLPTLNVPDDYEIICDQIEGDEDFAAISDAGEITLLHGTSKAGTATFEVLATRKYWNDQTVTLTVKVTKALFEASFSKSEITFDMGTQEEFYAPTLNVGLPEGIEYLVEYASSDENMDVLYVDDVDGSVTVFGVGTATITAVIVADGYEDATAEYTVTVVNSLKNGGGTVVFDFNENDYGMTAESGNDSKYPDANKSVVLPEGFKLAVGENCRLFESNGTKTFRINKGKTSTLIAPEGYNITSIEADGSNLNLEYSEMPLNSVEITQKDGDKVKAAQINKLTVTYQSTVGDRMFQTLTVGSNGMSSFCTKNALDFTGIDDVKAYIATGVEGTKVQLTQVTGTVAASTGMMLVGEEGASAEVPVIASAAAVATNMLKPAFNGSIIPCSDATTYRYVFGTPAGGEKGFYQLIGNNIPSTGNFAYLESKVDYLAGNNARALTLSFDDDATGIQQTIVLPMNDTLYNLAGQKVAASYKGIVIKNGKKMLNK